MSTESDLSHPIDAPAYIPPRSPRRWPWILLMIVPALGGAGWLAWQNVDGLMQMVGRGASEPDAGSLGDKAMLTDIIAAQQKSGEDVENLGKTVAEQKEQLKAMADRLAALASKIDALQQAAAAPASPPPAPPVAAASQPPPPAARALPKARRPGPPVLKPAGPVSVGGAPLSVAPDTGTR